MRVMNTKTSLALSLLVLTGCALAGCAADPDADTGALVSEVRDEPELVSQTHCTILEAPSSNDTMSTVASATIDYPAVGGQRSILRAQNRDDYVSCGYMNVYTPVRFECVVTSRTGELRQRLSVPATSRPSVWSWAQVSADYGYRIECQ